MTSTSFHSILIDVGNSALKWQITELNGDIKTGDSQLGSTDIDSLLDVIKRDTSIPIAISCVRDDDYVARLTESLQAAGAHQIFTASTEQDFMGFEVAYASPSHLGVDRWLAMLAARRDDNRPVIVVDAGTACTIDVLVGNKHLGGFILAGSALSQKALTSETARIRFDSNNEPSVQPGSSTADCVVNGSWLALMGAIEQVTKAYPNAEVLLDGGDAAELLALGAPGAVNRGLVFGGLAIWLGQRLDLATSVEDHTRPPR